MSDVYIYGLIDPNTKRIRYIGLTSKTPAIRLIYHLGESLRDNSDKSKWLLSLVNAGQFPEFVTLQSCQNIWEARQAEQSWIAYGLRVGWNLLNIVSNSVYQEQKREQDESPITINPSDYSEDDAVIGKTYSSQEAVRSAAYFVYKQASSLDEACMQIWGRVTPDFRQATLRFVSRYENNKFQESEVKQ